MNWLEIPDDYEEAVKSGEDCLFRFDGFFGDEFIVCRFADLTPTQFRHASGYVPLKIVLQAIEKFP